MRHVGAQPVCVSHIRESNVSLVWRVPVSGEMVGNDRRGGQPQIQGCSSIMCLLRRRTGRGVSCESTIPLSGQDVVQAVAIFASIGALETVRDTTR